MQDKFKSRKLIFAIVLFTTSVIFICMDKADFVQWGDFIKWVFGIYAAGNVGAHASEKFKKEEK